MEFSKIHHLNMSCASVVLSKSFYWHHSLWHPAKWYVVSPAMQILLHSDNGNMSLKSNAKHKDHFDKNDGNRAEPDIHVTLVTNDNIQIYMQKSAVGLERNTHSHKSTHQERQRCWMNEKNCMTFRLCNSCIRIRSTQWKIILNFL